MDDIVSIKKVFRIIDSCTNGKQLNTCIKLAELYTELVKSKGVVNPTLVKETIYIKINEKREELRMANKFSQKANFNIIGNKAVSKKISINKF